MNSEKTFERLRALTMIDNLEWLRSFGCRIERSGGLIFVHHDEIANYTSWLYMQPAPVTQIATLAEAGATVYVDDQLVTPELRAILAHGEIVARNETIAARVPTVSSQPHMAAEQAAASDAARWSRVYSAGFGRAGADARADLHRWTVAFGSPNLDHWFFTVAGEAVGVCQTTRAEVPGLYSFTLLQAHRGVARTWAALRALLLALALPEGTWVYFETLSSVWRPRIEPRRSAHMLLLRTMTGYHFSSARR